MKGFKVGDDRCHFNAWCGALVFDDSVPNFITRSTVILVSTLVSLLVIWSPRLLFYKPSNYKIKQLRVSISNFSLECIINTIYFK